TSYAGPLYQVPGRPCFHYNRGMADRGMADPLIIAGREFRSRLIVGTGKYKSFQETARALEASDAEMVTVAVRRVNLDRSKESLLDYIDPKRYFLLPNTAGCFTADEACSYCRETGAFSGTHAEETLCDREFSTRRRDAVTSIPQRPQRST